MKTEGMGRRLVRWGLGPFALIAEGVLWIVERLFHSESDPEG